MRKLPMNLTKACGAALALQLAALLASPAWAQLIVSDTFSGAADAGASIFDPSSSTTTLAGWTAFNGACLTAGDPTQFSYIPACGGSSAYELAYYKSQTLVGGNTGTLPDSAATGGALRLTNGWTSGHTGGGFQYGYNQNGAIVSNFTFPSTLGIQITFTTLTYRGDSGGTGGDGADGMTFFLLDDSQYSASPVQDIGAFGGSLGYTCSNVNNDTTVRPNGTQRGYDGIVGGYIGLGIDEYGNFLNQSDNTLTGWGYQPNRIGLRGPGNIAWAALNAQYGTNPNNTAKPYYPSTLTTAQMASAVQNTCKTGFLWNYASAGSPKETATSVLDYPAIPNAYQVLPSTTKIANESATTRSQAVPITYKLKITSAGKLSFAYSYNQGAYKAVITGQDITSLTGSSTLPANFRFGFAGSDGGSNNVHEILCFQATPSDQSNSSAGIDERQSARIQSGTQVYFAFYNPNNWSGSLTSYGLSWNGTLLSINALADWDASCVLTGVPAGETCGATGVAGLTAPQSPTSRTMLTWNGSSGIPFEWGNLSAAEVTALNQPDSTGAADGQYQLNFLRGDRTKELNATGVGLFRDRASVLGDIIDSSPTWVGPPQLPYPNSWTDKIQSSDPTPENTGQTYQQFAAAELTRTNVVYTGSNDGLLHGFRAGAYNSANVPDPTALNDGQELLAYMPASVLTGASYGSVQDVNPIHAYNATTSQALVDYSNPGYGHQFYVDATPGTGDLFYNNAWHTWLVGGLGNGGAAIYALDITNPSNFAETGSAPANAASIVIGEWNASTISCANSATCGASMGNTTGVPQIRRFHNGQWGAVFGNGIGSSTGDAGIFVMLVSSTGVPTFYYLSTGQAAGAGDGISYASPADLDGDHVVDYVYAGDLKGNVWRFDLTSANPSAWAVSPGPLFSTGGQPITTQAVVAITPQTGLPRVMIEFGTGRQIPLTNTTPTSYATGTQDLYGIWDWNMAGWNGLGSAQMANLAAAPSGGITTAALQQQVITTITNASTFGAGTNVRTITSNPICWADVTSCSSKKQYGWYIQLPGTSGSGTGLQNEQIVYSPVLDATHGAFIVNTTIPASNSPLACSSSLPTGWTMVIDPILGGAPKNSVFTNSTHNFVTYNGQVVVGLQLSGTGSVSVVTDQGGGNDLVTQTVTGTGTVQKVQFSSSAKGTRLTWIERR